MPPGSLITEQIHSLQMKKYDMPDYQSAILYCYEFEKFGSYNFERHPRSLEIELHPCTYD